nr:hypothetical protein CFP56_11523 [Quercus suber]
MELRVFFACDERTLVLVWPEIASHLASEQPAVSTLHGWCRPRCAVERYHGRALLHSVHMHPAVFWSSVVACAWLLWPHTIPDCTNVDDSLKASSVLQQEGNLTVSSAAKPRPRPSCPVRTWISTNQRFAVPPLEHFRPAPSHRRPFPLSNLPSVPTSHAAHDGRPPPPVSPFLRHGGRHRSRAARRRACSFVTESGSSAFCIRSPAQVHGRFDCRRLQSFVLLVCCHRPTIGPALALAPRLDSFPVRKTERQTHRHGAQTSSLGVVHIDPDRSLLDSSILWAGGLLHTDDTGDSRTCRVVQRRARWLHEHDCGVVSRRGRVKTPVA